MKSLVALFTLVCVLASNCCYAGMAVISTSSFKSLINTPVVTAGAYAIGNQVGGVQIFLGALEADNHCGDLLSVDVTVNDIIAPAFQIMFFDQLPTGLLGDHTALSLSNADLQGLVAITTIIGGNYIATSSSNEAGATNVIFAAACSKHKDSYAHFDGTLYAVIRAASTFTLTSTSSLTFHYNFLL